MQPKEAPPPAKRVKPNPDGAAEASAEMEEDKTIVLEEGEVAAIEQVTAKIMDDHDDDHDDDDDTDCGGGDDNKDDGAADGDEDCHGDDNTSIHDALEVRHMCSSANHGRCSGWFGNFSTGDLESFFWGRGGGETDRVKAMAFLRKWK